MSVVGGRVFKFLVEGAKYPGPMSMGVGYSGPISRRVGYPGPMSAGRGSLPGDLSNDLDTYSPHMDRKTPVKTLPSIKFVCGR